MNFQFQKCCDRKDKIYALISLLDAEGRSMIAPSYRAGLDQVFVDSAAACLVSRWREGNETRDGIRLTHDDQVFCDRLNAILDLTQEGIEARICRALAISNSYIRSMRTLQGTTTSQQRQFEQINSFAATSNQPAILTPLPSTQDPRHPADVPFEYIFREFEGHLTIAEKSDFAKATPAALNALITVIQNRQRANREMRNMTRLRGFIEQVATYHDVLEIFLGVPNIAAFVWVCRHPSPYLTHN